ncbi:MAG TPA: hypothetical protein VL984_09095 [Acidimicrobiales bacterium]|nr:hypothetical protein [Acidimicrobiales bacterium]
MEPLYGRFEHSLDTKGRFVVPAQLRYRYERNKDAAVVTCYLERCLAVWPPEEFNRLLAVAMEAQDLGQEERHRARALTGYSAKVDIDTQWRITVPSFFREYSGLEPEKPVVVVGVLDRMELWNLGAWRERMGPTMEGLAAGAESLFPRVTGTRTEQAGLSTGGTAPARPASSAPAPSSSNPAVPS